MNLVEKLVTVKDMLGLTDRTFAESLGMSAMAWSHIKTGRRKMGRKNLNRILSAYPDLEAEVVEYLTVQGNQSQKHAVAA